MDAPHSLGNILGLDDLLEGASTEVLGALEHAGFDLAYAYGFPNLQLSQELLGAMTPSVLDCGEPSEDLQPPRTSLLMDLHMPEDTAFAPI